MGAAAGAGAGCAALIAGAVPGGRSKTGFCALWQPQAARISDASTALGTSRFTNRILLYEIRVASSTKVRGILSKIVRGGLSRVNRQKGTCVVTLDTAAAVTLNRASGICSQISMPAALCRLATWLALCGASGPRRPFEMGAQPGQESCGPPPAARSRVARLSHSPIVRAPGLNRLLDVGAL